MQNNLKMFQKLKLIENCVPKNYKMKSQIIVFLFDEYSFNIAYILTNTFPYSKLSLTKTTEYVASI